MFAKLRRRLADLFTIRLHIDCTGDPADFACRAAQGWFMTQAVNQGIGMTRFPPGVVAQHRPEDPRPKGFGTSIQVIGPGVAFRIAVPYGATKWAIADAIDAAIEAIEADEATPEVIPFPADAPTPTPAGA